MAKQKPIEIITPPNALKAKVGGQLPALDINAITRAEMALSRLSDQFGDWIKEELHKLVEAWADYEKHGPTTATRAELHRRAHDLKGLAPTYGFPLVGRVCGSLCKLTGDDIELTAPAPLLLAHVNAVKVMVKDNIRTEDHPLGKALTTELESQMLKLVASVTPKPE